MTALVTQGVFLQVDRYIDQLLPYTETGIFYYISKIMALLYLPLLVVIFVMVWRFIRKKQELEALMLLVIFSGWVIPELIIKPLFDISCPPAYYANVLADQGFFRLLFFQKIALLETCYPSAHTTAYVVFFGYFIYLALIYVKKLWLRRLLITNSVIVIFLVGPSRIYLHGHWLSDIIAGYLLGFALLILIISLRSKLKVADR